MEPLLALLALAILGVVILALGFRVVQQAETIVVERLGRYHRTLESGINVILPIVDRPRQVRWRYVVEMMDGSMVVRTSHTNRIDLREQVYDFPRQNVITKDNVSTEINAMLYFQITDPVRAVYEIVDLPNAIEKLTQTSLRNVVGELDLDQLLSSRDTVNSRLRGILDEATDKWGVKVNRVEIQDITPPPDVKRAMEQQMRAERDKRAAILEAEGRKQAEILRAEGDRQSAITRAEGEREARIMAADAEAQARLKEAEAEARALEQVREALGDASPAGYLLGVQYIEALKSLGDGKSEKVVYLPYEATGLMASIGGIRDLFTDGTTRVRRRPVPEGVTPPSAR